MTTVVAGVVEVGVRANLAGYTTNMQKVRSQGTATAKALEVGVGRAGGAISGMIGRARQLAGTLAGPTGLIGLLAAVTTGFASSASSVLESTRRQQEFANALTVTGNRSRVTAGEIERLVQEISQSSGRTVDEVRTVAQELVKAGVVGVETFREILQSSSRLASSGFGSLEQNAQRLAGALNDPRQALVALHEAGIEFTEQQARTVRRLVETNRVFEALRLILDNVREKTKDIKDSSGSLGNELLGAAEDIGKAIVTSIVDLDWLNGKLASSATHVRNWRDQLSGRADDVRVRNLGLDQIRTNIEAIEKAFNDLRSSGTIDAMNKAFLQLAVPNLNVDNLLPMQALTILRPELERYKRILGELEEIEKARDTRQSSRRASEEQIKRSLGLSPDHLAQFQRRLEFERQTLGMTEAQTRAEESLLQLKERGVHLDVRAQANLRAQVIEVGRLKEMLQTIKDASTSVFDSMAGAIVDFATTGKVKFKELANSIVADLLRIALRAFVTNQIVAGITGLAGSAFGSTTSIGSAGWAGSTNTVTKPGMLAGFDSGGSFKVPGSGAGDRPTLVGLAPGELVTITPQHRTSGGGGGTTVNVVINSSREFESKQNEREGPDGQRIIETILTEVKKDMGHGGFDSVMAGRFGSAPKTARR